MSLTNNNESARAQTLGAATEVGMTWIFPTAQSRKFGRTVVTRV